MLGLLLLGRIVSGQGQPPGPPARAAGASRFQQGKQSGADPTRTPPVATPPGAFHPAPLSVPAPGKKTPAGERFFIVASVDLQRSQLLLKYPTEVTVLVRVDNSTKLADDSGRALKLSDFRAGDTVWVASAEGKDGITALRVRKGQMDVSDLHRYYLDYPAVK